MSDNIWVATADNQIDLVKKLIESGKFTPNSADPNGFTPIHAAASYGHLELLRYLLENGGNVNIQDSDGDTPLHHTESLETAKILIQEYKADYRLKNKDGLNVKEYFIEEDEYPELISYFELLEKTGNVGANGDDLTNGPSSMSLPNGQEIRAFLGGSDEEETPEILERRKQVESIFTNTELSEAERDEKLREFVMGVVSENIGTLRDAGDDSDDHKRKR